MAFRRDKQKSLRWESWLHEHRDELIACGIPHEVFEHQRHWGYFLDHGYFKPEGSAEPIIDVDRMGADEAQRLRAFLERDDFYPESVTLRDLQRRLIRDSAGKIERNVR